MTAPDPADTVTEQACGIDGCSRDVFARGWCGRHYNRWRKYGDPETLPAVVLDPFERMRKYIEPTGFCWNWTGVLGSGGYGSLRFEGRRQQAHRWVFEQLVGPIPEGLELDHLCRNRACVNPDHLEPVTRRENTRRGLTSALRADFTCPKGHDLRNPESVISRPDGRRSTCRECRKQRRREARTQRRLETS